VLQYFRKSYWGRPSSGLDTWDHSGRAAELHGVLLGGPQFGADEDLPGRHILSSRAVEDLQGRHLLDPSGRGAQLLKVLQGRHLLDSPFEVPPVGPPLSSGSWGNEVSRHFQVPPAAGPPRRSKAPPAGGPPHSVPVGHQRNEVVNTTHDVPAGQHQKGAMTHACGKATPLHDVMVPGYSQKRVPEKGVAA
jgi:hypothetical protein